MSALSSLLVQDKIVSVSTIEEALQRQVIFGGQLDTNLLELRAVDEQVLIEYKARVNGMVCASKEEIDGADIQTVKSIPREIAEKYFFVPVRFLKDAIRVAVCSAPFESRLDEAAAILGIALEPAMTSEFRLRVALNKYYGSDLPSRFSRLAGLLAASPPRVQSRRVTGPPPPQSFSAQGTKRADGPQAADRLGAIVTGVSPDRHSSPGYDVQGSLDTSEGSLDQQGIDLRDTYPGTLQSSNVAVFKGSSPILALPAGLELIEHAQTREDVFDAALRVVGGMVEYAAVFVVKGNVAHGRASWGRGTSSEELVRRPVLLEKPGALWTVTQTKAHYLGPLPPSRANDSLLEAIGRSRPATVLIVPVVLRNRAVVLLYADSGARSAIGYELAALLPLASAMAGTFERLIMERKRGSIFSSAPPPPPQGFSDRAYLRTLPPTNVRSPIEQLNLNAQPGAKVDAFRPDGSDSGVSFTDASSSIATHDDSPVPVEAPTMSAREELQARKSDTFFSESSGMGGTPFPDGYGPSTPDPGSRSSEGVLILLTEVLGDPQERAWESKDDDRPSEDDRPTDKDGVPAGARASTPSRPYEPKTATGKPPQARSRGEQRARKTPARRGAAATEPAARGSRVGPDGVPRGLPDPTCLQTAVEPESVEVLPDPEFFAPDDAAPQTAPRRRRRSDAPSAPGSAEADEEPRQTPLEVAIAGASVNVVVDTTDDVIDEGIPIDVEDDQTAARRTALPNSAAASGETVIRRVPIQIPPPSSKLPKVIVDMGSDIEELVDTALGDGPGAEEAARKLTAAGEVGLPSLIRRFPGNVPEGWENLSLPVPKVSALGRLLALLQEFGVAAVPYLIPKLHSADRAKRFFAVLLLGNIENDDALEAIGLRLLDYDARVASLAGTIISKELFKKKLPPSVYKAIRAALTDRQVSEVIVARAADAAGIVRDRGSVPALIDLLRTARGARKQTALNSLRLITGQDLGNSARRWSTWWGRARHQKRAEWLIDALDHRQERVRARAAAELNSIADVDFGFTATAPRKEREAARRQYQRWWQEEGRARFKDLD